MPRLLRLSLLLLALLLIPSGVLLAQDKTLVWNRYDVNIKVMPNADMEIEEIQEIMFTNGSFHFGYRSVPLDRVESLRNIRIYERQGDRLLEYKSASGEAPYTFKTWQEGGEQVIRWYFPETSSSSHTYVIRYTVTGGLRIYDDGDQVWWKAIGADHSFPIVNSLVRIELPTTFRADKLLTETYGVDGASSYAASGSTAMFSVADIRPDQEFEVRVQFPHGAVRAQAPAWQAADDARRAAQEKYGPVFDVGLLALGLLLLFGGPMGIYALWYLKGKDAPVGLVSDYISEPPDDLAPGVVGTLVDEQADMQDILATLVDLARRGVLHIEEVNEQGFLGIGSHRDFTFHLQNGEAAAAPYEQTLVKEIFGSKKTRKLSSLKQEFYQALPKLRRQFYDDVVQAGYFPGNPRRTRTLYMGLGVAALIVSIMLSVGLFVFTAEYSGMAICPSAAMILTAIVLIVVGRHMPKKTRLGAEEAAKWEAFKKYLKSIEHYGGLEEAKSQFEKYLPYAIAFGIEKNFLRQFEKVEAPAPAWYGPYPPIYRGPHYYGGQHSGAPTFGGSNKPTLASGGGSPTLSDMSRGMGTSLSSMSAGLGSMLSAAGRTFSSAPSSSGSGGGGGFSGGGFSGGGGGGGGSAGFG